MIDEYPSRLQVLNRVSAAMNGSIGSDEVIDSAVSGVLTETGLDCGVVYWFDELNETLVGRGARGFRYGLPPGIDAHSKRSHSLPSRAYRAAEPLVFDIDHRRGGYQLVTERERRCIVPEGIHTAAFVKIHSGVSPYGVLALCTHQRTTRFDADWMELFSMVAEQVGAALDRAISQEEVAQRAADLATLHEFTALLDVENDGPEFSDALGFARRSFGFERCEIACSAPTAAAESERMRSMGSNELLVPLVVDNCTFGYLIVTCTTQPGSRERRLATAIAERVAVALWRGWRYQELNRFSLAELRNRLARDIHDDVAQRFYVIQLNLTTVTTAVDEPEIQQYVDQALHHSQRGIEESRQWAHYLRQKQDCHQHIRDDLTEIANNVSLDFGLPSEVRVSLNELVLDIFTYQAITTVVRELLYNVGKHAAASNAWLDAWSSGNRVVISVSDDGNGFDSSTVEGFGLRGVRERMAEVGGCFTVSSRPTGGTVATLSIPRPEQ